MRDVFVQTHPGHAHAPKSRVAARECKSRPAARLRLLFREISAELSKLPRPLQKPPLPLLLFFCGRRRVSELIDLLACKVDGLRCGFRASPLHELRSCQPQLDKPTDGLGAVRFIGLPRCPSVHIFTQFGRKPDCRHWVSPSGRPASLFSHYVLRDAFIFLVLPKEATTTCPKDRGRACGMGVRGQSWRASATTTAAPITSAARFSPRGPLGISNLYVWNHVEKGRITPASDF